MQRHQTLRALVDWSYDLLNQSERTVLNRLSVFVGGFEMEAAEQVCGAEPLEPPDVLDLVASLVDKSLVMSDEREQGTRYRMLETIRDYAFEKLVLAGDAAATAARHCQHFLAFAKTVRDDLPGQEQAAWIERMEVDLDNVRAGIALALSGGVDPIIAVKYAVAMQSFWYMRGYASEGRNTVHATLDLAPVREVEQVYGHALYVGAALAESQSDYAEARTLLEQCLVLRRRLGDPIDIAATLTLSPIWLATGDVDVARNGEQEALAIFRQEGNRVGEVIVLSQLGQVSTWAGDNAQARGHFDAGLALACELGHREVEAECELRIGEIDLEHGAPAHAREHFVRSLAISQEAADKRGQAGALWWLAKVDLDDRAFGSARARLSEALRAFRAFEMHTAWNEGQTWLLDYAVHMAMSKPGDPLAD